MDERLMVSLKQDVRAHFEQRYGPDTVHFDELHPKTNDAARIQVTISNGDCFITRY